MAELALADGSFIDELMEITAQSLAQLEIQERFNIIKEIGRGKYGKVLLVTHCFKGNHTIIFFCRITVGNKQSQNNQLKKRMQKGIITK